MPPNHIVLPMPWPNNRYRDFFFLSSIGLTGDWREMEIIWACNQPIKERRRRTKNNPLWYCSSFCHLALLGMILFLGRWHAHLLYLRERLWVSAKQVDTPTLFFSSYSLFFVVVVFGQAGACLRNSFLVLSLGYYLCYCCRSKMMRAEDYFFFCIH